MATPAEDLRAFLAADGPIAREVGSNIHENHVPMNVDGTYASGVPFLHFVKTGEIREDCTDSVPGEEPEGYRFALEIVTREQPDLDRISALISAKHNSRGTFGARTIQRVCFEDPGDDYEDRTGAPDRGFPVAHFNVEVYLV